MKLAAIAAGFFALLPALPLEAQSSRSLIDSENDILLAQGARISVPRGGVDSSDEVEALQERILLLRATIKSLTDSLAIANDEAEVFRRKSDELTLKLEALGLAGVEKDQSKLEQRLLSAVRDLRVLKKQNEDAVNQLIRLSEAIQVMGESAENVDPQVRNTVEAELRKTSEVLGAPDAATAEGIEATLTDGMVVDVQDKLSLVVGNIGSKQKVRIGMPFQVWRNNKIIGEVRVVDVRERFCGAIIQSLESENETVKTGDRLKVDARQ